MGLEPKLRALDLTLPEFQQLLGVGEVIGEADEGQNEVKELVQWVRPLHVAIVVDSANSRRDW